MATLIVPSSDPIDPNGRLRAEWRIFFNQITTEINTTLDSTAGSISALQTQLAQETAAREGADALLLPKDNGRTGMIGFQGAQPVSRLQVIGSKAGNAALRALIIQLARYGLITDSTT